MRRFRSAIVLLATTAMLLSASAARATHMDGDGASGTFDPQITWTTGATLVNRPGDLTLDATQVDHEDPATYTIFRQPGDWQFVTDGLRAPQTAGGAPATQCRQTVDGSRDGNYGNATLARAVKVGDGLLDARADGFGRPAPPDIVWDITIGFMGWDPVAQKLHLCFVLVTQNTALKNANFPGVNIEDVVEIITDARIPLITKPDGSKVWESELDIGDLTKDEIVQQINGSLIEAKIRVFGMTTGTWNPTSVPFTRAPKVSGSRLFQTDFWTCPQTDPTGEWGNCLSQHGPVQWTSADPLPAPNIVREQTFNITLPAPTVGAPANNAFINVSDVAISGTADPDATVHIYGNGGALLDDAIADATGAWTKTIFLPQGNYTVNAKTFDAGTPDGGPVSNSRSFTVDVPPAPPVIASPADGATIGAGTFTLNGTAQPASTVKVYDGTTLLATTTAPGGNWATNVTLTSPKGPHTLVATARDLGGEGAPSAPIAIDLTTALPVITVPAENAYLNTAEFTVTGTTEPGATIELTEGGLPVGIIVSDATTGDWSHPVTGLPEGPHAYSAIATALDGFVSPTLVRNFTIDFTAPDVPSIATPVEGSTVMTRFVKVTGTAEPLATVTVSEAGVEVGHAAADATGNYTVSTFLTEGGHTVSAVATDLAGNVSEATADRTFTVIDPLKIKLPLDGSVHARNVPISVTTDTGASRLFLYDAGVQVFSGVPINGKWTGSLPFATGQHLLTARTTIGGELGPPTVVTTFTVDDTKPVLTIDGPGGTPAPVIASSQAITGSANDKAAFDTGIASVKITYTNLANGASYTQTATCTGCTGPTITFRAVPQGAVRGPGVHRAVVIAYDKVGNASVGQTFTVIGG